MATPQTPQTSGTPGSSGTHIPASSLDPEKQVVNLLMIDDDDNLGEFLSRLLTRAGYNVTTAQTGHRGLELAQQGVYDLALLDIELPDMTGYEICRQLKLLPGWRDVPVMMLSGNRSTRAKEQGFALGIADYLSKPFSVTELRARINVHLQNKLWHDRMNHENLEVRREAQSVLQEIRERFVAMSESSFDLICEIDEAGLITFASPSSTSMLGLSPAQLINTRAI
ncbi:MAG: response regulator, partial [Candidatus Methylacidiphilales bacterium]